MTEKILYRVLCDEYEEVARIFFEVTETGEQIEGSHQIQKWINNVFNENEQLKKENLDLSEELDYYKTKCASLETGLFQADKDIRQLKSRIKEVTELLSEEVDLFSDKATEHDINAYVELIELDNKDAFYMATATKKAIKMLKELQE